MQWPSDIDLLPALRTSLDHLEVSRNRPPLLIIHAPHLLVTHPRVSTSPSRVHPHDMLKPEIFTQRHINDFDRHGDELPALDANVGVVAACSDVIVVRQIDIEAQFLGEGLEGGRVAEGLAVARVGGIDGADLETGGA